MALLPQRPPKKMECLADAFGVGFRGNGWSEEEKMSGKIDPEAGQPSTVQGFELSDRNPVVNGFGGTDAEGGLVPLPTKEDGWITPEGPAVSADEGLKY